jgi:hypothetical protein
MESAVARNSSPLSLSDFAMWLGSPGYGLARTGPGLLYDAGEVRGRRRQVVLCPYFPREIRS